MVTRNYQCAICHKLFRKETGMQSHLARSHETPAAMEVIRQDYETKKKTLEETNHEFERQLDEANRQRERLETELKISNVTNLVQGVNSIKSEVEAKRLKNDLQTVLLALTARSYPQAQGNEQTTKDVSHTKSSDGEAEMTTLQTNDHDPLAAPAAPIAWVPVSTSVSLESPMLPGPKFDPEELKLIRSDTSFWEKLLARN